MKLLKCSVCGNIVEMIEDKGVPVMCCGKPMDELKANTTDGALENMFRLLRSLMGICMLRLAPWSTRCWQSTISR